MPVQVVLSLMAWLEEGRRCCFSLDFMVDVSKSSDGFWFLVFDDGGSQRFLF